ncbi:Hypothetical protein NTJ_11294 [Nesidiocoris tenuis]|uniref:Uncharacterized protein n=1 Tax=Nesidiocoris tenuis TaxID=355587 RepID=A0ABN7B240_9HEMI|nr:Hypothetical protein NTJ_11294 [Nesidiocoris tenuis]
MPSELHRHPCQRWQQIPATGRQSYIGATSCQHKSTQLHRIRASQPADITRRSRAKSGRLLSAHSTPAADAAGFTPQVFTRGTGDVTRVTSSCSPIRLRFPALDLGCLAPSRADRPYLGQFVVSLVDNRSRPCLSLYLLKS